MTYLQGPSKSELEMFPRKNELLEVPGKNESQNSSEQK
jgi:hypothetical protein